MVAAGLPLVIALVGLGISSGGLIVLLANVVDVPDWTTAVSGLIGIGVGIDYSLLVLTRFRSAMHDGKDRHDAVVEAVTTAGRSVIIAGATVVIAVLGLALTGLPYMYGVALSASIAVLVVMLASVTLLPALLSFLGPRVDRLRIPFLGRSLNKPEGNGESPAARWSHAVQRRPWTAAIAGTALLLALAAPALGMRLGFPDAGNDPPDTMTRQAYDLNTEGFGPGTNGPLVIAAEMPGAGAQPDMDALADRLRNEPGVAFVAPPRINASSDAAIVTVIPRGSPQDEETSDLVNRLRDDVLPDQLAGTGITAEVGGVTAALEDQSDYILGRMPLFIIGVVGLSFLLLLVAFHSPLISLKAGIMNLLSVSAAYGVMTIVAKGGTIGGLIGIDHEVPIAPVHAGDDVRDPLRPLDGLRGVPDLADPRGVPEGRRHPAGGGRRPGQDRPGDHRGRRDHGGGLPRLPGGAGHLPEAVRDRAGLGDLPRRHRRADGAGTRRDAAPGPLELVDPGLAGEQAALARRGGPPGGRGGPGLGVRTLRHVHGVLLERVEGHDLQGSFVR